MDSNFFLFFFSFFLPLFFTLLWTNSHRATNRVSFGSSKGSMVETLVFETPTPLPEHSEREFAFTLEKNAALSGGHSTSSSGMDDSGIELPEE